MLLGGGGRGVLILAGVVRLEGLGVPGGSGALGHSASPASIGLECRLHLNPFAADLCLHFSVFPEPGNTNLTLFQILKRSVSRRKEATQMP